MVVSVYSWEGRTHLVNCLNGLEVKYESQY